MFDERFARQYRYELPSEFPLSLLFTGIVHHLSGPIICAHTQTSHNRSIGCWCKDPSSHFHCAHRFVHPWTRTHDRLLGPCFKTGRMAPCSQHPTRTQMLPSTFDIPKASLHVLGVLLDSVLSLTHMVRCIAEDELSHLNCACAEIRKCDPSLQQSHQNTLVPYASFSAISDTFNSLSKVLFIFPSWYLFAIGLTHIFSFGWNLPPALRSNPEERDSQAACRLWRTADNARDCHPQWCSFPRDFCLRRQWQSIERLQVKTMRPDFHVELFPGHSPLLRESWLVSFPPLTYMLKFSGLAYLTSCLNAEGHPNPTQKH